MINRRRYPVKTKNRFEKQSSVKTFKPDRDTRLKKVFDAIGIPKKQPFKPDPFQLKALAAVDRSDCLVTAPTGAGKTWIAQQAIKKTLKNGGKSWYASPLKALSNSKYEEFKNFFSTESVGILTGDRKENPDAPIIVGTTEILRNQLYDAMRLGTSLSADFVVLDEAHFLGDPDRGVVWEEIIIYLPTRIPLLLLSATIGNATEIADWLFSIRQKKCALIQEKNRPVPLSPLFLHPSGTLLPLLSPIIPKRQIKTRIDKKVAAYLKSKRPKFFASPRKVLPFGEILSVLKKYHLLPAIFFLKSRADCDNALDFCMANQIQDPRRKMMLREKVGQLTEKSPHIYNHRQRWFLENLAVGAHHSGQLPSWKLVLEQLMTEGLLDAIFATSTVAAGVNFPARTVAFLNSDKFNGSTFLPLTPTEFHQMTGRAGRRGMDHIGFAVSIPGKFMDVRWIAKLFLSHPSDIMSQIRINFSMVLNLLLSHTPDQIRELLTKSFATHQLLKRRKKKTDPEHLQYGHQYLWQDFLRHLNFLKQTGYVGDNDTLTDEGVWASQLRIDHPLMIAEGFRRSLFPEADPALLAAIMTLFVNEQQTDDSVDKRFSPKTLLASFHAVKRGLQPFSKQMSLGKFEVKPLFFRPAAAGYAWAAGFSWDATRTIAGIEDGNLVMLILRTADCLRHVASLKQVFPVAAETADASIKLILRDPVIF